MTLLQGINLLSSLLFVICSFYFLQAVLYWTKTYQNNTFDLRKIINFLVSPFKIYSYRLFQFKSIIEFCNTVLILIGVFIISYFLFFDLLKLFSLILVKKFPGLVFSSFLLAVIYLSLLSPFIVFLVGFFIRMIIRCTKTTVFHMYAWITVQTGVIWQVIAVLFFTISKELKKHLVKSDPYFLES
jgi:hypothetical protein